MLRHNREYEKYIQALEKKELLSDIQMFRISETRTHIAAVVLSDGNCYVYFSTCSDKDQYVKRIGRNIAMGRALKLACWTHAISGINYINPPRIKQRYRILKVDPRLRGNALRDELRKCLRLPQFYKATFTAS